MQGEMIGSSHPDQARSWSRPQCPQRRAFTRTGLLTVAVLAFLLASLTTALIPTIRAMMLKTNGPLIRSRIQSLYQGADMWAFDTGDGFPGSQDCPRWEGRFTGSQILAAHLFGLYDEGATDPYHALNEEDPVSFDGSPLVPQPLYAKCGPNMFKTINGRQYTIVNTGPTPKPICYYVSDGNSGQRQYRFSDNEVYTGRSEAEFLDYIRDLYAGDPSSPARDKMFLLIDPGKDEKYFSKDDSRNWRR